MEIRFGAHPQDVKLYDTQRLRDDFLIDGLFSADSTKLVYSQIDRIIVGGVCPVAKKLALEAGAELKAAYFLERREMGIINIGGKGTISIDGVDYDMDSRDGIYIGMGAKDIAFSSADPANPAKFYLNSCPAHHSYPTIKVSLQKARRVEMGSQAEANKRVIHQYIHPEVLTSCQLVMGMTILDTGSVWNTMPTHTHDRRMEVYLYLNIADDAIVFHLMGQANETRHIVVRNEQAVISPSWSIHSGVGTKNYAFIWGMCGENQTFTDMDFIPMSELK